MISYLFHERNSESYHIKPVPESSNKACMPYKFLPYEDLLTNLLSRWRAKEIKGKKTFEIIKE